MKPDPSVALNGLAQTLIADLSPDIRTPFGQSTASMSAGVAMLLARQVDGLVDRLVVENDATAAILSDACTLLTASLADRVRLAVRDRTPADLKVSTVQAINDRLRALLIEVHAEVEAQDSPQAAALNERIWSELAESTRRREVDLSRP